jgi:hypothetical protein
LRRAVDTGTGILFFCLILTFNIYSSICYVFLLYIII